MTVSERDDGAARSPTGGSMYVYGVARAGIVAGGAGVLGGAVTTIESGEVSAIVSDVDHENVRAKRRDLLLHAEVLQRAFAAGPVLPFRFGTVFPSARALADELLSPRQTELLELLGRFDGNGELRVRAAYHDQEAVFAEMV